MSENEDPGTPPDEGQITVLLRALSQGSRSAEAELIPLVYDELRRRAASYMRIERPNHTLQPTALVHELYLKLMGQKSDWQSRAHFFGVAARQMRRILVEHARKHRAEKRGGGQKVSFDDAIAEAKARPAEFIELDQALTAFGKEFPRKAEVVELRLFGGLLEVDIAKMLRVSPETVRRDWRFAKVWLSRKIKGSA